MKALCIGTAGCDPGPAAACCHIRALRMGASLAAIALSGILIGCLYAAGLTSGSILEAAPSSRVTVLLSYRSLAFILPPRCIVAGWATSGAMAPVWKEGVNCARR